MVRPVCRDESLDFSGTWIEKNPESDGTTAVYWGGNSEEPDTATDSYTWESKGDTDAKKRHF